MRLGDFKYLFKVSGARRFRGGDLGLRIFAVVLAIGAVVIALGPEAKGVVFGKAATST